MSTEKELLLKELDRELADMSQNAPIGECEEDSNKCPKCHSSDINKMYIAGHDVLHCICIQCGKEWVE